MRRRSHAPTITRGPIPRELAHPRIADWLTDDDPRPHHRNQRSGEILAAIADPRYRQAVAEWFAEWCGPYDDDAPVALADFETAQRAAEVETEIGKVMRWARRVSIGNPIPWGP